MKQSNYSEICSLIIDYIKYSESFQIDKTAYKKVNKTIRAINKHFDRIAIEGEIKIAEFIDKLLGETDIRLNCYGAIFAINCNYKISEAIMKINEFICAKKYIVTASNAERFISMFYGIYPFSGWKRDESYPDLSKYENEESKD